MGVRPAMMSALQGPSVRINENVKLHRLFERNEIEYPEHMAVIHGGTYIILYKSVRKLIALRQPEVSRSGRLCPAANTILFKHR